MNKSVDAIPDGAVDQSFKGPDYQPGVTRSDRQTVFKLYCPRSPQVDLVLYKTYEDASPRSFSMSQGEEGWWYLRFECDLLGWFYGYDISAPADKSQTGFLATEHVVADPYSKWVAHRNNHLQEPLTKIVDTSYDWDGDDFISVNNYSDLVIYETHIKDITCHPSSRSGNPGTYRGFIDSDQEGGIAHLKRMGVNAVELLPLQKYAYFEPPYKQMTDEGIRNHWNPYARNHWGYMTSFFFAPETRFASNGSHEPGVVNGLQENGIREFKDTVKALHNEGIAVIMDVVYNHVSQYDLNPLKYIDESYYFRLDDHGNLESHSGCGNDFKTEAPMARKLILDSIEYWMEEFHIDGFRFDLAPLIDWETMEKIKETAISINPDTVLIAEPWGAHYDPNGYSDREIGAWNDKIRNGVKGSHPVDDPGFIMGEWQFETSHEVLRNLVLGTLEHHPNGLFNEAEHSVNYLESHDGYTLGDFIRISQDHELINRKVQDERNHLLFSSDEMKMAKLGAMFLFVSQGVVMIHQGQEWGRSKVIAESEAKDPDIGKIDHDSYNKDNATNHLNFEEMSVNHDLVNYYRGLIALRKNAPALRNSDEEHIHFHETEDPLHLAFHIDGSSAGDPYDYFVAMNGNNEVGNDGDLPRGTWELVADNNRAGPEELEKISGHYELATTSGIICRKLSDSTGE